MMNVFFVVILKGIIFVDMFLFIDECFLKMVDCSFMGDFDVVLFLNFVCNLIGNVDLDGCNF